VKRAGRAFVVCALASGLLTAGEWKTFTNCDFITDLYSRDSTVHAATAGGLVSLVAGAEGPRVTRRLTNTEGLPLNRCLSVTCDSEGNVWVGTDGGGLAVVPADSWPAEPYRPNEVGGRITTLVWDGDRLLAGSEQGLYVIDTRGTLLDCTDDVVRRFEAARIPELMSDKVLSLASHGGRYWVGTNMGLTAVDTSFLRWQAFRRPLGDSVRAMAVRGDGRLVLATEEGLVLQDSVGFTPLVVFDSRKLVYDLAAFGMDLYLALSTGLYKVDTLDTAGLKLILQTDARAVHFGAGMWLGSGGKEPTGDGLRYQRSGQAWTWVALGGIGSNGISDCAGGLDGSTYLGHNMDVVSRVFPDGAVWWLRSPLPWVVQIRRDSKGKMWCSHYASNGGLSAYDPEEGTWQVVQWGEQSGRNIIQAFGLDAHDTKWVFSLAGTVVAVDSVGWQQEFNLPELVPPPGGSYEFAFDSRGRVWLGLTVGLEMLDYGGTLHDRSDDRHRLFAAGLPSTEVRSVAVDGQDRVWVATPRGAAVLNGETFLTYTPENSGLLSADLSRVRVDGANRVWLLSDMGLSIFDPVSNRWENYTSQNSGLIANSQGFDRFYTALDLDDELGVARIGTVRGFSLLDWRVDRDTAGVDSLRVYPNPCVVGFHGGVVIDGLPPGAEVYVYSLSGAPVAVVRSSPGLGRAVWLPGKRASGIYILVISSSRGTRVERVALVGH